MEAPAELLTQAHYLARNGRFPEAEGLLTPLIAGERPLPEALFLLARVRYQQGRLVEASPLLTAAVQADPSNARYRAALSRLDNSWSQRPAGTLIWMAAALIVAASLMITWYRSTTALNQVAVLAQAQEEASLIDQRLGEDVSLLSERMQSGLGGVKAEQQRSTESLAKQLSAVGETGAELVNQVKGLENAQSGLENQVKALEKEQSGLMADLLRLKPPDYPEDIPGVAAKVHGRYVLLQVQTPLFDEGRKIAPEAQSTLDGLATWLKLAGEELEVTIIGHGSRPTPDTDDQEAYSLGLDRAVAVLEYLASKIGSHSGLSAASAGKRALPHPDQAVAPLYDTVTIRLSWR